MPSSNTSPGQRWTDGHTAPHTPFEFNKSENENIVSYRVSFERNCDMAGRVVRVHNADEPNDGM